MARLWRRGALPLKVLAILSTSILLQRRVQANITNIHIMPPAVDEKDSYSQEENLSPTSPEIKSESPNNDIASREQRVTKAPVIMASTKVSSTKLLKSIEAFPSVRRIPWREGQELSQSHMDSETRTQEKGAFLLVTRGDIQPRSCTRCAAGNGKFSECVALEALFQGSCASCVFAHKASECSLRFKASHDGKSCGKMRF